VELLREGRASEGEGQEDHVLVSASARDKYIKGEREIGTSRVCHRGGEGFYWRIMGGPRSERVCSYIHVPERGRGKRGGLYFSTRGEGEGSREYFAPRPM